MFARFRNLFAKSKADEVPIIIVEEAPSIEPITESPVEPITGPITEPITQTAEQVNHSAPLACLEDELCNGIEETTTLSASTQELSQLLDAINLSSKLPDISSEDTEQDEEDYDDEDDETTSTSSVRTKITKASLERDIIFEETEDEEEVEGPSPEQNGLRSLDKIKALIRNDSETYPQSDYTDTEDPTPMHSRTPSMDSSTADALLLEPIKSNLLSCDYSIVPDELPLDSSPSPLHDSGRNSSTSSDATTNQIESSPATLTVMPTGSNELACAAISHKLGAIAEVAESLDAVIRDCSGVDADLSNVTHKKLSSHGNGSEDWQSRSTEDESFATASEGNFTPNSHSSSFQTASGRTSSYIGSAKNSFDEADESTFSNFDIPELPQSPVNMSFDSSELSYFSAQQPSSKCDDQDSVVGVAELHSQSVTPTPEDELQRQLLLLSQPIESDSELEALGLDCAGISTTELMPCGSTAVTPEVSARARYAAAAAAAAATNNNEQKTLTTTQTLTSLPPPASWRRSKYYENITKQTIKGFL